MTPIPYWPVTDWQCQILKGFFFRKSMHRKNNNNICFGTAFRNFGCLPMPVSGDSFPLHSMKINVLKVFILGHLSNLHCQPSEQSLFALIACIRWTDKPNRAPKFKPASLQTISGKSCSEWISLRWAALFQNLDIIQRRCTHLPFSNQWHRDFHLWSTFTSGLLSQHAAWTTEMANRCTQFEQIHPTLPSVLNHCGISLLNEKNGNYFCKRH